VTVKHVFFVGRQSQWELLYENLDIHFDPAMDAASSEMEAFRR
jgi:hypothetical protein